MKSFTTMISSLFRLIADHPVVLFFVVLAVGFVIQSVIMIFDFSGSFLEKEDGLKIVSGSSFSISVPGLLGAVIGYPWTGAGIGAFFVLSYLIFSFVSQWRKRRSCGFFSRHFGVM